MAKFEVSVSNGFIGATRKAIVEIPDAEIAECESPDQYIESILMDYVLEKMLEWDYEQVGS